MQWRRRRQPDPVEPPVMLESVVEPVVVVLKRRRTRAERANDLIVAEQAAVAEGQHVAERLQAEARQRWEQDRPRSPVVDGSRFTY